MRPIPVVFLILWLFSPASPADTRCEIDLLLDFIGRSQCTFIRNAEILSIRVRPRHSDHFETGRFGGKHPEGGVFEHDSVFRGRIEPFEGFNIHIGGWFQVFELVSEYHCIKERREMSFML